ncbi:MAG: peptidylprolyl isomerase [Burkholderiales bacterium]
MHHPLRFAVLALGLAVGPFAHAQVAKVNGVNIPQSRMDFIAKNAAASGKGGDSPEARTQIKEALITLEIITQEANKKGLDKTPEVVQQLDLNRQEVLRNAVFADYLKANPITDDQLRKEYDKAKAAAGDKDVRLRVIAVDTEDEAKQIIASLKKGANFEKLAAEKSKDPGTKGKGGDLDWGPVVRYPPTLVEAVRKLKKGQLADQPVQVPGGWLVVKLEDERPLKIPPFDEVKPQLMQQAQQQAIGRYVSDLRAKAKVE